ncbi:RNA polymerase sigma factor [Occallatibacter riparius]|uniref:RNA polymerase sigma factor n=1 Tax=Occallatibacter riparius TaxID=1002689 RepID=A0A9J7BTG0_9BACT|nr:RNA polymerase sigma factor [Occallatibacter riparius]UWZ85034.1 RNA polymerase sigma factor [Occallatibacter riparius]
MIAGDVPKLDGIEQEARNAGSGVSDLRVNCNGEVRVAEFLRAVEKHRARLLWVATQMMRGEEQDAEDVVQEALMRAFRNLGRFRAESQMGTWLQAIVKNAAREYMRNWGGKRFISMNPDVDDDSCVCELPDPTPDPEQDCVRREREHIAHAAVGAIGPTNRETVQLCVFEELPYMEVATLLNVSTGTIKARMFRSRLELRDVITGLIARL